MKNSLQTQKQKKKKRERERVKERLHGPNDHQNTNQDEQNKHTELF